MNLSFKKAITLGAVVSIAVGALAGCASSANGQGSSGADNAGTPVAGGTLVIARGGDSGTLVPTEAGGNDSIWVLQQIFEPLVKVSKDGKSLEPNLATKWEQSADGLSWDFTLRDDVTFSDGTPVTVKDVVFSLPTATYPELPFGFANEGITEVKAVDEQTVRVTTKTPWAPLLSVMALFSNSIVPENYGGKTPEEFAEAPIGTGPFALGSWEKGQKINLVKNEHYWQDGLPYLDGVTYTVVGEANTRLLQVQGGQAQVDEFPSFSSLASAEKDSRVAVRTFESSRTDYMIMSQKSEPFQDQHVRAAVAHAVDKNALIKAVLFGNGEPANSFLNPSMWGYDKNQKVREFDLEAAKKELAQSKYPNGFETTIEVVAGNEMQKSNAEIIQASLEKIGIDAKIVSKDDSAAGDDRVNGTYDIAFTYSTTDISDPDELVKFVAVESGGANAMRTFYPNEKIEAWASEAAANSNPDERLKIYSEIQTEFNDQQPLVPLYYSPSVFIVSPKLQNFNVSNMGSYELTEAWLAK